MAGVSLGGQAPAELLSNADGQSPFTGVARYQGRATCTAVLIDTGGPRADAAAPAYGLTNGHCPEFPGPNQIVIDRTPINHRLTFHYFGDTPAASRLTVAVRRVSYATMKAGDVAVLELDATLSWLRERGVKPLRVAFAPPKEGDAIAVAGAPLGFPDSYLRLAACTFRGTAPLVLEYIWHWHDLFRNDCGDVKPGSSGSPVIERRSLQVHGLVNTTTRGAVPYLDCYLDHPCEPAPGGARVTANTNYVTPVTGITRCFPGGRFDVNARGCPLEPPGGVTLSPAPIGGANPDLVTVPFGSPKRTWNVRVDPDTPYYRWMVARTPAECAIDGSYSEVTRTDERPVIDAALPREEGVHLLCVIGGSTRAGGGAGWQQPRHGSISVVRIDRTPPKAPSRIDFERTPTGWRVAFFSAPYEIASFVYKVGRPSETRCSDPEGYRSVLVPFISISMAGGPQVFCTIPYDDAGNAGEIVERLLT